MKHIIIALLAALVLAGCNEPEPVAAGAEGPGLTDAQRRANVDAALTGQRGKPMAEPKRCSGGLLSCLDGPVDEAESEASGSAADTRIPTAD